MELDTEPLKAGSDWSAHEAIITDLLQEGQEYDTRVITVDATVRIYIYWNIISTVC